MEARRRRAADDVKTSLCRYVDRGIFRSFRARRGRGGRDEYAFVWLWPYPMTMTFDPTKRVLTFPGLFPGVPARSPLEGDLKAHVDERSSRWVPAHKRLSPRVGHVVCQRRSGGLSLKVTVKTAETDRAVRNALNLVNELFLLLQAAYPEYLIEHFGASVE